MIVDGHSVRLTTLCQVAFRRRPTVFEIAPAVFDRAQRSRQALLNLMADRVPIYGVTTGFGDSADRTIDADQSEALQKNLVAYLLCGTGPLLSPEVSRAVLAIRLNSLARGFSGVTPELLERLRLHLEKDWIPVIPREGSLGASGDLVPLAYLAQNIQGAGEIWQDGRPVKLAPIMNQAGVAPYRLKAKEGLALVNGTSAMAGLFAVNLNHAGFFIDLSCLLTSWLCLALRGRTEAFGEIVNARAKAAPGQTLIAARVRRYLEEEGYRSRPLGEIAVTDARTAEWVQDRYSLRCVPQILGPFAETLTQLTAWLEDEINSAADNPLIDGPEIASGGNFYGGYLSQGMDYLKISLAHLADLIDRQVAYVVDDKSNRGLPPNLANWPGLPSSERHLHHGLKGLHQSVSAITSEILARATPGGIFSRSAESHNQDKVSLGMSAGVQAGEMIEPMFNLLSLQTVILAQALDLRGVRLQGKRSRAFFERVRAIVPFVERDRALGEEVAALARLLKDLSASHGGQVLAGEIDE